MHIDDLPTEILTTVFSYLPLKSLITLEAVSKRWLALSRQPNLWRNIPVVYFGRVHEEKHYIYIQDLWADEHAALIQHIRLHYISRLQIYEMLNNCPNITVLELIMCILPKEFFDTFQRWRDLTHIHFKNCLYHGDYLIDFIRFPKLKSIVLTGFGLTNNNFADFLRCERLIHIDIHKIRTISNENIQNLLKLKKDNLVKLRIYGGPTITDRTSELISECTELNQLCVIRCEPLTDLTLHHLRKLRKLKSLQIWNNDKFTKKALKEFFECPQFYGLRMVSLSRIKNVSSQLVSVFLENYNSLAFISFYQCAVTKEEMDKFAEKFPNAVVILD